MGITAGIPYLLVALLSAIFLWGSIVAIRGRRWWATILMLIGSGGQVLGALTIFGGMIFMFSRYASGSGSGSALASGLSSGILVAGIGSIVLLGGVVLFAAGFVGFCARSGPTERRAAELEGMVQMLQERLVEPR